jgi:hypothetical protein
MTSTKTRFEFSFDSGLAEQLNARAEKQGIAKSDIVVQAVKAFLERRTEDELAQLITQRFDTLAHDLGHIRNDLGAAQNDRAQIKSDTAKILENIPRIIDRLNAKLPPPDSRIYPNRRARFFASIGRIASALVFVEPENERRNW